MDAVASFPDVGEFKQKLPVGNGESSVVNVPVIPFIPLSTVTNTTSTSPVTNYNLQLSAPGADGMINVTGVTRPFTSNLKTLGGNWHKEHSCWKFESKYESEVKTLIEAINSGKVQPEKIAPYKNKNKPHYNNVLYPTNSNLTTPALGTGQSNSNGSGAFGLSVGGIAGSLPIIPTQNGGDFQTITYTKVFVPKVGMVATIKMGNNAEKFQVVKVGSTGTNVDHAIISTPNGNSELVVMKGHWKVNGMLQYHNVYFERK